MTKADSPKRRLDRWLHFARFAKSRSLAQSLIVEGRLRVNGVPTTKAHAALHVGDVLTFAQGPHIRIVKILDLGQRRGPAAEARALYEDLAPPPDRALRPAAEAMAPAPIHRAAGSGRPTKRDRRALDRWRGD